MSKGTGTSREPRIKELTCDQYVDPMVMMLSDDRTAIAEANRPFPRTVRDLVVGSELRFADHGKHELKGIEEPWHLYALE
jgi:hypothetical protein